MVAYRQGYYIPKNPEKYIGNDITKIVYRSSWELKFFEFVDNNTNVLQWSSEPIAVPYVHPFKKDKSGKPKISRYFPDLFIKYKDTLGNVVEEYVEIKPLAQCSRSKKRNVKHKLYDDLNYAVNVQKWKAMKAYVESINKTTGKNVQFKIITEQSLFLNGKDNS